jgi:hypothetical protein
MKAYQFIPTIILITAILKTPGVKKGSLHHHILWQWMFLTHPAFCQVVKDIKTYHSAQQWGEWITPVREDMMGWAHLLNYKPQSNILSAAFPTFIGWGKATLKQR